MQTVDINTKYKIPRSIKLLHFEAGSLLIGAEFHSVEMSASGRHLCVWRVVCPTTETYYISVHTHTHTYVCVYFVVLPHRRRILFEGGQCSRDAMVRRVRLRHGGGWFPSTLPPCLARLTDKQQVR